MNSTSLLDYNQLNRGIISVKKIMLYAYYLSILTISFDNFMVIDFGFNFRISQVIFFVPIGISMLSIISNNIVKTPLGFKYFIVWSLFILMFIPNTNLLIRNIGYGFWLIYNGFLIFATVQLFNIDTCLKIIKWYIYSFYYIAIFGLIQFFSPFIHINPPLLAQWLIPGSVARINGFSYEPSYFATYLFLGWVSCAYLLQRKSNFIPRKKLKTIFIVETLAIVLSTSRLAWIFIALWFSQYPLQLIIEFLKGNINKQYAKYTFVILVVVLIASYFVVWYTEFDIISFILSSLGFGDGPMHSLEQRSNGLEDTLMVFLKSPIIGYSLGGVSSAIAEFQGVSVYDYDLKSIKESEGLNVFAEVLAASGIVGVIPFMLYIAELIIKPLKLARQRKNNKNALLLRAMVVALIFELLLLQFNQNILRPYLWLHIALLSSLYANIKCLNEG